MDMAKRGLSCERSAVAVGGTTPCSVPLLLTLTLLFLMGLPTANETLDADKRDLPCLLLLLLLGSEVCEGEGDTPSNARAASSRSI